MLGHSGVKRITREKFRTLKQFEITFWDYEMKKTAFAADRAITLQRLDFGGRLNFELDASTMAATRMYGPQFS